MSTLPSPLCTLPVLHRLWLARSVDCFEVYIVTVPRGVVRQDHEPNHCVWACFSLPCSLQDICTLTFVSLLQNDFLGWFSGYTDKQDCYYYFYDYISQCCCRLKLDKIVCLYSCKFLTSVHSRKDSGSDGLILLFESLCHLKETLDIVSPVLDQLQRQCLNTSAQYHISHLHSQGSLC